MERPTKKDIHILALQPKQQAALNLILQNFLLTYMSSSFDEIADEMTVELVEIKKRGVGRATELYFNLSDALCTRSNFTKATPKLVMLSTIAMKAINAAISTFDKNKNLLQDGDPAFVMGEYQYLRDTAEESLKHVYTHEDLKKAGELK
jgi:hypothetical protein